MKRYFLLFLILVIVSCSPDEEEVIDESVKQLFQEGNDYYDNGDYKRAIDTYNEALRIKSDEHFIILKRGDCYRKLRQPQRAMQDYDLVIALKPSIARAYYHRGTLKFTIGKKTEGCEDIRKAKALCYFPAEKYYADNCQ